MIDQRLLPHRLELLRLDSWQSVRDAVQNMAVRGAPAIGVAAAYGLALAAMKGEDVPEARQGLAASRPTAVNLFWALDRVMSLPDLRFETVLHEAQKIEEEDIAMNRLIAELGAGLVPLGARVLTLCNTGSLATAGHGTALGIVRTAFEHGKIDHVYACETRPRLQGLRLTAWELLQDGIPFQSIADSAAASLMSSQKVDLVLVGADRIAANGDTANKIGTLALAVMARHFEVPFYVAAPTSTLDPSAPDGSHIPIEERDPKELTEIDGIRVAPDGCPVWNPGFDVTPGSLITAIVTEQGVHQAPFAFSQGGGLARNGPASPT
jgi:methylthioribose-1-phosphate isomerase